MDTVPRRTLECAVFQLLNRVVGGKLFDVEHRPVAFLVVLLHRVVTCVDEVHLFVTLWIQTLAKLLVFAELNLVTDLVLDLGLV